jgi:hypothetical protein
MRKIMNTPALALAASLALAACTATAPTEAAAPEATPPGPPPGASGKLSPDMVGKVSPVPAFMGQGEHLGKRWMIHIRSEGQMRHRVELIWTKEHLSRDGELFYRGMPGPSHGAPITLDGTIDTHQGRKPIHIEITTVPCTDDTNAARPQRVKISVQGDADLNGCGDLAVY